MYLRPKNNQVREQRLKKRMKYYPEREPEKKRWFTGERYDENAFCLLKKIECDFKFDWSWEVILPLHRLETDEWWPAAIYGKMKLSDLFLWLHCGWAYGGLHVSPQPCREQPAAFWIRYEQPWAAVSGNLGENDVGGRLEMETALIWITCVAGREGAGEKQLFVQGGNWNF